MDIRSGLYTKKQVIMNKIYIVILLNLFLFSNSMFSQSDIGLVKYDVKFPSKNLNVEYKETRLYFNDSTSVFVHSTKKRKDAGVEQKNGGISLKFDYADEQGQQVFRDFKQDSIILRFPKSTLFSSFTVKDNWLEIVWEIKGKTKKIGEFTAQKAVGKFRGRKYTAWFTEQIPLPYGPWKLFGLPGLILEANDDTNMFVIKFRSINYPCNCTYEFKRPTAKESKTLKELVEFSDNYDNYVLEKMKARLPRNMRNKLRKNSNSSNDSRNRAYRKEVIFEWETETIDDKNK